MDHTSSDHLHYLVAEKSNYGVAHCLDLDLVATAEEGIEEAIRRLDILVRVRFFTGAFLKEAPGEFWDRFQSGIPYAGQRHLNLSHPEIEVVDPPVAFQFRIEAKRAA